jgi:type I restriction enzyme, S subunit
MKLFPLTYQRFRSMSEWKELVISEIIEVIGGGTPKTTVKEYWNGEIPWLSVVDFNTGRKYVSKTEKTITIEGLNNSSTKLLKKGDLIISARGTVGVVAMLRREMAFNQSCYGIRAKSQSTNDFVYYLLKERVANFLQFAHGGVFDTITRDTFKEIEINLPPLPQQKAIASILSSLDDKIDLLHRQNATLEKIAETLFRQWFVEEVKEDWETRKLGEVAIISAGGDKPKIFSERPTEKCKIPIYSNGIDNEGLFGYTDLAKINIESITISARGTIGFVCLRRQPYVPIVRLITIIPKSDILTSKFLYFWAKSQNIYSTGTTQQQLTVPDLSQTKIQVPTLNFINAFTSIVDQYFNKIDFNQTQIRTLTALRDTLLPKLMSRRIRIKNS